MASACSGTKTAQVTEAATTTATTSASAPGTAAPADLKSLIPTPADTQQTYGPDTTQNNGIHLKFNVSGTPSEVMSAYKTALQNGGWQVTTIVTSSGGGGGGATYTGTHGDAYGVFDGGGFENNTYVTVCAWPSKPADPNCSRG
jgi:hypothetical protein